MPEQERNHYINRHEEIGDEVGRCRQNTGWMIAVAVLTILLVVSVCFNVFFLASRGDGVRGEGSSSWMGRPCQNRQYDSDDNNAMRGHRGDNSRDNMRDKEHEQKEDKESDGKSDADKD